MREEYDRLAWGFVKEEIRHLLKARGERVETVFMDTIRPPEQGFYDRGWLNDARQKIVRHQILNTLRQKLATFHHETHRTRVEDKGGRMTQDSMSMWGMGQFGVKDLKNNRPEREEMLLELKHASIAVGKKKLIADMMSSFVLVNEHTLYRLIQRGAVANQPIRFISGHFEEWVDYAFIFAIAHRYVGEDFGSTLLIPFRGGAFLAKASFTETHVTKWGWGSHNMRFTVFPNGQTVSSMPFEHITTTEHNGTPGAITIHISTWIPDAYLSVEQWWAKFTIQEFVKKHHVLANFCRAVMSSSSRVVTAEEQKIFGTMHKVFQDDLTQIMHDRRWGIACRW